MKKIILTLIAAFAMLTSVNLMAAGTNFDGQPIDPATNCTLLSETVTVKNSTGVHGAYQCDALLLNTIKVATCHEAGSRKATPIACAQIGTDANGDPVYNDGSCDGTPNQTYDIADFRAFAASSTGGQVGTVDLGGNCTDGSIAGINHFD